MRKKLIYLGLATALTAGAIAGRPAAADAWVCTTTCDGPDCCSTCCRNGFREICTANPCFNPGVE
jgi:hypothetical protein